ncbi:MAG: SMP-30/gluconolactonase/LRE family protein [Sphingomicrobium sp.]
MVVSARLLMLTASLGALTLSTTSCMSAAPPTATPPASWTPVDGSTGQITDVAELGRLAEQFPNSASLQRRILGAVLRAQNADAARGALQRLADMGYALRADSIASLAPRIGEAAAALAEERAMRARQPFGTSAVVATIGPQHRLIEGLAWDTKRQRLFVSSVVDRALLVMDGNRGRKIAAVEAGSLFGLAIDEPRRILWIGSGAVDPTPEPATAFRGLIGYHLDREQVVARIAAPANAQAPADLAIGPEGSVYVSDSLGGAIYALRPGAAAMETLVAAGALSSPQGIAAHPDGRRLYVADYDYGIAIVDIASGVVRRLAARVPMMLDGVDGLLWDDGYLVAIQNGTDPRRILRIALDSSGTHATTFSVIEQANPQWGEPTIGQIVGHELMYVSDPQWERFGPGGKLIGIEALRPNRVRIVPLRGGDEPARAEPSQPLRCHEIASHFPR